MAVQYGLLVILLLPLLGSGIGYYIGFYSELRRNQFSIVITAINLMIISAYFPLVSHGSVTLYIRDIMGTGLHLKMDMFRYVFVWITAMVWFLTSLYTTQYLIKYTKRNRYYAFFMLTYASTIGIFISDNLLNLFTFFEIMSLASYALVIHDEDEYSHEAGRSYISMALAGGLILLTGLILLFDYTGTLLISDFDKGLAHIGNIRYVIATLIIIGFGVKASMVPLHTWLSKAYAAAPTPATAVLSGVLVKTGIFGVMITVLKLMNGDQYVSLFMICIGCVNIIHGGVLAVMQRNIKRILAYSSMSQVGYIFIGIGLVGMTGNHGGLALVGSLYHIFNHALFKVLLFMGVGIIYMVIHELSISKIQGFGKNKKLLKVVFMIGCLATMGMPGTCGFISKTLIHEAIIEARALHYDLFFSIVETVFILGASLTVAYLMKIFVAVFFEENQRFKGQFKHHVRKRALFPMGILGLGIIFIGLMPDILFNMMKHIPVSFGIEEVHSPHFFTVSTIIGFLIPFLLGNVIYFGYVRTQLRKPVDGGWIYVNPSLNWIELENDIYRPITQFIFTFSSSILKVVDRGIIHFFIWLKQKIFNTLHLEINYQSFDLSNKTSTISEHALSKVENQRKEVVQSTQSIVGWSNKTYSNMVVSSKKKSNSIKELIFLTGSSLNSLLYTVITFVFVLVMILIFMK